MRLLQTYGGKRSSQSAAEAIDANGIAFFGVMHNTAIECWNTATEYGPSNIVTVAQNPVTLQFASGVKVCNLLLCHGVCKVNSCENEEQY